MTPASKTNDGRDPAINSAGVQVPMPGGSMLRFDRPHSESAKPEKPRLTPLADAQSPLADAQSPPAETAMRDATPPTGLPPTSSLMPPVSVAREQFAASASLSPPASFAAGQIVPGQIETESRRIEPAIEPAIEEPAIEPVAVHSATFGELTVHAQQIAEHLKSRSHELDRREQRLHVQLAHFENERRASRLSAEEYRLQLAEREQGVLEQEVRIAQRLRACEQQEQTNEETRIDTLRLQRELADERIALDQERESLLLEFRQERTLLENRIRFQQDHLQKTRAEHEAQHVEVRVAQQQQQTALEERYAQLRLRSWQLDRVHERLMEREQQLDRDHSILNKAQRAWNQSRHEEQQRLAAEAANWEQLRTQQAADLNREREVLTAHAEHLEARRERLEALRAELEESNRQVLETRLATEETQAALTQAVGGDVLRERLSAARDMIAEHYRHSHDSLLQQRHELEETAQRVQQNLAELQGERQQLTSWLQQQEFALHKKQLELDEQRSIVLEQQQELEQLRNELTAERLQNAAQIRELQQQLTDTFRAQPPQPSSSA